VHDRRQDAAIDDGSEDRCPDTERLWVELRDNFTANSCWDIGCAKKSFYAFDHGPRAAVSWRAAQPFQPFQPFYRLSVWTLFITLGRLVAIHCNYTGLSGLPVRDWVFRGRQESLLRVGEYVYVSQTLTI
jgi:hypothetical protein